MMYTFIRRVRRIVLFTLLAALLPAVGNAQAIASNFQELRFRVEPGDTIYITDRSNRETAAEIVELSRSALTVRISGEPRALAEQDVRRIRQRLPDPLWTGALIGVGIGAGLGTAVASISDSCSSDGGAACWAPVVAYASISAGVGLGIDALIKGRKVIYEAPDSKVARWLLSPMVSGTTKGALIRVLF